MQRSASSPADRWTRCAGAEMIAADRETFLVAVTGHSHVQRAAHDLVAARLEELRELDEAAFVGAPSR